MLSSETSNSIINCLFLTIRPLLPFESFTKVFSVFVFPDFLLEGKGERQMVAIANCLKETFQFSCKYVN